MGKFIVVFRVRLVFDCFREFSSRLVVVCLVRVGVDDLVSLLGSGMGSSVVRFVGNRVVVRGVLVGRDVVVGMGVRVCSFVWFGGLVVYEL